MKYLFYFLVLVSPTWSSFDDKTTASAAPWVFAIYVVVGLLLGRTARVTITGLSWAAVLGGTVGLIVGLTVGSIRGHWDGAVVSAASIAAGIVVLALLRKVINPGQSLIEP